MSHLVQLLDTLFPQVQNLQLNRMLYWRGTVSYEPVDYYDPNDIVMPKLLQRRIIGTESGTSPSRDHDMPE